MENPSSIQFDDKEKDKMDNIEELDDEIGDKDGDIISPFSVKDIRVTTVPILLPSVISRLKNDEISIPEYQRHSNLWTLPQMSRLIESILLKLPLPVFYFDVSDPDKWMVIDGLQRISTIRRFFVEKNLKLRGLEFLQELNGKGYDDFERGMQRTVDETQLITYQIEAQTPKEVRYSLFNRINTGGLSLKPQEIRQALNQKGGGVKFLATTIESDTFKSVVAISNKRMAGQELVLRFMAFQTLADSQFKTMGQFLDLAMEKVDQLSEEERNSLKDRLLKVLLFSEEIFGPKHRFSRSIADKNKNKLVNFSIFDVLTVCLDEVEDRNLFLENKDFFVKEFKKLLKDEESEFFTAVTKGTSGKWAKNTRFEVIRNLIKRTLAQ